MICSDIPVCLTTPPLYYAWERDWYGRTSRHNAYFSLSLQDTSLTYRFRVEKPPECAKEHAIGDFVEGLWQHDVCELFVMAPDGRYQEFNVSPTGAWWSAVFSSYRQIVSPVRPGSVVTRAEPTDTSWSAELSIETKDLVVLGNRGLEEAQLSVTSILCPGDPEYLCWGHQSGGEPDFHRQDTFKPISWVTKA